MKIGASLLVLILTCTFLSGWIGNHVFEKRAPAVIKYEFPPCDPPAHVELLDGKWLVCK